MRMTERPTAMSKLVPCAEGSDRQLVTYHFSGRPRIGNIRPLSHIVVVQTLSHYKGNLGQLAEQISNLFNVTGGKTSPGTGQELV